LFSGGFRVATDLLLCARHNFLEVVEKCGLLLLEFSRQPAAHFFTSLLKASITLGLTFPVTFVIFSLTSDNLVIVGLSDDSTLFKSFALAA